MTDNQDIKNRILEILKYLGMSQGSFEKECGLANGWVSSIKKSISTESIQRILDKHAEINPAWIISGEGSMIRIRTYASNDEMQIPFSKEDEEECNRLRQEIEELKETIARQNRVIDALTGANGKEGSQKAG